MRDYHPAIQALEAKFARQREGVRQLLYERGRPDLVSEFDRKMREIDTGIDGARNCWHSLSSAQRRALQFVVANHGRLFRSYLSRQYLPDDPLAPAPERPIRVKTIRALCAHNLLAWDGGAFAPEAAAVITERGLFVLRHGPVPETGDR